MDIPECIRENVPLAGLTTFKIGGPARWFAAPANRAQVSAALAFARERGIPVLVMGGGSNLLVADAGVEALVIRLDAAGEFGSIQPERPGEGEAPAGLAWRVGAAASLPELVSRLAREGVCGPEAFAGIPGRVGGAAAMNAGAAAGGFGQFVMAAEVADREGNIACLDREALNFSYRGSGLPGRLALSFELRFSELGDGKELTHRAKNFLDRKRSTQPLAFPSAGCVFKNPSGTASAGALLDWSGCKGLREGGAEVSTLHANFIINTGGATCRDVVGLLSRLREVVREKHGIILEPEIRLWGPAETFPGFGVDGGFHTNREAKC